MEDCRDFRRRYRHVIEEIDDRYPGFWTELRDLAEGRERRRTTTRGATVREFPRTRDQGIQATEGRTLGQCLFGVAAPGYHRAGTQTESASRNSTGIQTDPTPPEIAAAPLPPDRRGRGRGIRASTALRRPGTGEDGPAPAKSPSRDRGTVEPREGPSPPVERVVAVSRPPTRGSSVCWNCRATDHRYSNCPLPRDRQYCYGCGRDGVTLRTCPSCREDWKDLGPYHPDRGHLGH